MSTMQAPKLTLVSALLLLLLLIFPMLIVTRRPSLNALRLGRRRQKQQQKQPFPNWTIPPPSFPIHKFLLGIVGGNRVEDSEWPSMVSLMWNGRNHFCGGSIWSADYIVTAAHCLYFDNNTLVPPDKISVYVGHPDITIVEQADLFVAQLSIPNENYQPDKPANGNDIGLIKLARSITFSANAQCLCIPENSGQVIGTQCFVIGWGQTSYSNKLMPFKLREVRVPLLSADICTKYTPEGGSFEADKQLCAGYVDGGKDACQGDSGGPLMCAVSKDPYVYELTGIVSFGSGCARAHSPGYYTRVATYLGWLRNKTGC